MSPCESCHAGCCRSFAVPLSGADILRIERDLGLDFWEFGCRWADPDGNIARGHAPHFRFIDEPETPFVICLQHTDSQVFEKTTKCRFLMESHPDEEHPLGVARCGIYNSRPAACRAFPTKLNETSELAIIYDVPQNGRGEENPVYNLCPRRWQPEDFEPLETVQELVLATYEMNFFRQLADAWNRSPQEFKLFPEFLRLVYSGRIQVGEEPEAATSHEDPPVILAFPSTEERSQQQRVA